MLGRIWKGPTVKLHRSYRRTTLEKHGSNVRWEALLKDESGKIVWACGHAHRCRDNDVYGVAAWKCSTHELERRLKCEAA